MKYYFYIFLLGNFFKLAYGMHPFHVNNFFQNFDLRQSELYSIEKNFVRSLSQCTYLTEHIVYNNQEIAKCIKGVTMDYFAFFANNRYTTTLSYKEIICLLQVFAYIDQQCVFLPLKDRQQHPDKTFSVALNKVFDVLKTDLFKKLFDTNRGIIIQQEQIIADCLEVFYLLQIDLSFFISQLAKSYQEYRFSVRELQLITQILMRFILPRAIELNTKDVASTIWALAKIQTTAKLSKKEIRDAMTLLLQQARCVMNDFNAREVANIIWGLARLNEQQGYLLRETYEALMQVLLKQIGECINQFNAQDVANTVWGLAKLSGQQVHLPEEESRVVMQGLFQRSGERIREFNPQNISNTIWGFAKLSKQQSNLPHEGYESAIRALLQRAREQINNFNAQDVASTVLSLQRLNKTIKFSQNLIHHFVLFAMDHTIEIRNDFLPFQISNTLLAIVKLNVDGFFPQAILKSIILKFMERLEANINNSDSASITDIIWSLEKLLGMNQFTQNEFKMIRKSVIFLMQRGFEVSRSFGPKNISKILLAISNFKKYFFIFSAEEKALIKEITVKFIQQAKNIIQDFNEKNIANTLLAIINFKDTEIMSQEEFNAMTLSVIQQVPKVISDCSTKHIRNIICTIAQLKDLESFKRNSKIVKDLLNRAEQISNFCLQDIEKILYAALELIITCEFRPDEVKNFINIMLQKAISIYSINPQEQYVTEVLLCLNKIENFFFQNFHLPLRNVIDPVLISELEDLSKCEKSVVHKE